MIALDKFGRISEKTAYEERIYFAYDFRGLDPRHSALLFTYMQKKGEDQGIQVLTSPEGSRGNRGGRLGDTHKF